MSQKSEIKVYLPLKLIGELEGRKRIGQRSRFIEAAVREKLSRHQHATLQDWNALSLLCNVRDRFEPSHIQFKLLQLIIDGTIGIDDRVIE